MGLRNPILIATMLAAGQMGFAQSSADGVGRTPTAEEIKAWDISTRFKPSLIPQAAAKSAAQILSLSKLPESHTGTELPK